MGVILERNRSGSERRAVGVGVRTHKRAVGRGHSLNAKQADTRVNAPSSQTCYMNETRSISRHFYFSFSAFLVISTTLMAGLLIPLQGGRQGSAAAQLRPAVRGDPRSSDGRSCVFCGGDLG